MTPRVVVVRQVLRELRPWDVETEQLTATGNRKRNRE
jgi:hypothetical protein